MEHFGRKSRFRKSQKTAQIDPTPREKPVRPAERPPVDNISTPPPQSERPFKHTPDPFQNTHSQPILQETPYKPHSFEILADKVIME